MTTRDSWLRRTSTRVGACMLTGLVLTIGIIAYNQRGFTASVGDAALVNTTGAGRMRLYRLLHLARGGATSDQSSPTAQRFVDEVTSMDGFWPQLLDGLGERFESDQLEARSQRLQERWRTVRADLQLAANGARDEELLTRLDTRIGELVDRLDGVVSDIQRAIDERVQRNLRVQYLLGGLVALLGSLVILWAWRRMVTWELARNRVSQQEARVQAIFDASADAIVTIDEIGTIESFNRAAERLFGYSTREIIGENVRVLVPSPHHEQHDDYLRRYCTTGEAHIIGQERELEAKRKDGTLVPIALRVTEVYHLDERRFIGIVQDISDRHRQQANKERMLSGIADAVRLLAISTSQLLASATEQAAGSQQQAAAVAETVATVDEVAQTSEQATARARTMSDSARKSKETSLQGREAVNQVQDVLRAAKETTDSVSTSIVGLAERTQAIGEIIATVDDLAEQTNMLSLNAAIEASRAGVHGRGFTVVATEVKNLAERSKKATGQVRRILGEIQKSTNNAVMATEESTKSMHQAIRTAGSAGETINALTEVVSGAAQSGQQIAASSGQQATGIAQITLAMRSINEAATQNLSASKQIENSAQDLNGISLRLEALLDSIGPSTSSRGS